jgi:membrane associated rhomboid family serine protease
MSNFTEQHYVVQMQAPAPSRIFTPVMTTLMAILILCSALAYWIGEDFCRYLVIIPPLVERGWLWQLVSYASIDMCVITMLFNLWIMLFIGSALERQHKAKSILVFCLTMAFSADYWRISHALFPANTLYCRSRRCYLWTAWGLWVLFPQAACVDVFLDN